MGRGKKYATPEEAYNAILERSRKKSAELTAKRLNKQKQDIIQNNNDAIDQIVNKIVEQKMKKITSELYELNYEIDELKSKIN